MNVFQFECAGFLNLGLQIRMFTMADLELDNVSAMKAECFSKIYTFL